MKLKAVFLDKDGALIPELPNENNRKAKLNERFIEGLQLLQSYGYLLVIVSNPLGKTDQASSERLETFKKNIIKSCSRMGIYLDGFYYGPCTNGDMVSGDTIALSQSGTDLLLKAAGDMDIDLSMSWMIGDIVSDVEAGKRAGCNTVLVANGKVKHSEGMVGAKDLADAAKKIVKAGRQSKNKNEKPTGTQRRLYSQVARS